LILSTSASFSLLPRALFLSAFLFSLPTIPLIYRNPREEGQRIDVLIQTVKPTTGKENMLK